VWFDEERIEPFASIPDRVRAGLGEAKVLAAWYSAAYPTRRACREELTLALLAAERAGEGPERVPSGIGAADLDAWRCPAPCVAELITSREAAEGRFDRIPLDVLDPADALALLSGGRPLDAGERQQARLLAAELGYYPLACDVADLYVRSSTSFAAYRALIAGSLEAFDALAAELSGQLPGDHARQITATLATSLNGLGSQAWQLLRLAAQLAPAAIPKGLIAAVFADLADGSDSQDPVAGERAADRALLDAHGDGLWRFDPHTHNVDVHVLVRQTVTILDPDPASSRPGWLPITGGATYSGRDSPYDQGNLSVSRRRQSASGRRAGRAGRALYAGANNRRARTLTTAARTDAGKDDALHALHVHTSG
jgi:hypothetical protein